MFDAVSRIKILRLVLILALILPAFAPSPARAAASPNLVISQVYGAGGNADAVYTHDFVELFNLGSTPVSLKGLSIQYASATGTGSFSGNVTPLTDQMLAPGQYYLVQLASQAAVGAPLPTPDTTGSTPMAAGGGKVALVNSSSGLACNGSSSNPCDASQLALIIDLVGFGTANFSETATAPSTTAANSIFRAGGGCTDTDNNRADFTAAAANPRNTSTAASPCTPPAPGLSIADVSQYEGNSGATAYNFSVTLNVAQTAPVTFDIATTDGDGVAYAAATAGSDYTANSVTGATIPVGETSYTFTVQVTGDTTTEPDEAFFVNISNITGVNLADGQAQGIIRSDDSTICTAAYTPVSSIQGPGASTPLSGQSVTTKGVVVGDFEGSTSMLHGFYLQDQAPDADPATSEGIFVYESDNANRVSLGDVVVVTGTAGENNEQTQVSSTNVTQCGSVTAAQVTPVALTLPLNDTPALALERYEGMLVKLTQTLTVTDTFQLGRFGEVVLSFGGRLAQPTNVTTPGAAANALQAQNVRNQIMLDDDRQNENGAPVVFGRGGSPLSSTNTLRGGDTVTGVVGVLTYTNGGNTRYSPNAFRVRPINALGGGAPDFQPTNPRPASSPDVSGSFRVVGLNVHNYFNSFSGCTLGVGGGSTDCRGATNTEEFNRQYPKTVAAITATNADVIAIAEVENDGYGASSAIQDLVNKLNTVAGAGTYAFINPDAATGQTNSLGTDAIKVGILYKPGKVTPVGTTAVLNTTAFVRGGDSKDRNRPSLAQAFADNASGERFIVDINHFKSKGSACDDPDANDGQANCNGVRVNAATALVNWLGTNPTGTGDPDILILGDLNAYAMEDPITYLTGHGYTNLIAARVGASAYSYSFDGQWGYLDHALASPSLAAQVAGVAEWHINSDEPVAFDYPIYSASQNYLWSADLYRTSDHDPIVVGLNLTEQPPAAKVYLPVVIK